MKKNELIKMFIVIILSLVLALSAVNVFAADTNDVEEDEETLDLTQNVTSNTTKENTANSTNASSLSSNMSNTSSRSNTTNTTNKTNSTNTNSSSYNNTNLPATGIEDSIPTVALIIVFGISSIYAYKKVRDYKDIK